MAELNDLLVRGDSLFQGEIGVATEKIQNGNTDAKIKKFAIKLDATTTTYTVSAPTGKHWFNFNMPTTAALFVIGQALTDTLEVSCSYKFDNKSGTSVTSSSTLTITDDSPQYCTLGYNSKGVTEITFTKSSGTDGILYFEVFEY